MAIETVSAAGGNIDVSFLQQVGSDPFTPTFERSAQIKEVATKIASFIGEARATLDIAIYDFQLRDDAATIIADALRERAKNNVVIRIIYDAATNLDTANGSPAHLEADRKRPGTESFVQSFSDLGQVKAVTGYRVLMHNKYIIRDGNSPEAALIMGSPNYTNDSWGLQENNLLRLRSQPLASLYSNNFAGLLSTGRIAENFADRDVD